MNRPSILRLLVTVFGVLTAALVLACGYLYLASAATLRAIDAQRDELAKAKRYAVTVVKAKADIPQIEHQVKRRRAPWTWSEQLPVMVAQMSDLLEHSKIKPDTMQPVPVTERQQLTRFPLRLTLHTDLKGLTNLLQRVQEASPLLAVDQVVIRAGEKPADPLRVEITLSSYIIMEGRGPEGRQP